MKSISYLFRALLLVALTSFVTTSSARGSILKRKWIEASSAHFQIFSSAGKPRTVELLEKLEIFHSAALHITGGSGEGPELPVRIFYFNRKTDFEHFHGASSVYMVPSFRGHIIVTKSVADEIIFHEYTHYLLHYHSEFNYPSWYQEGFSEMLGATRIDKREIYMMGISLLNGRRLKLPRLPLEVILKTVDVSTLDDKQRDAFYGQSWALVHFLHRAHEGRFPNRETAMYKYLDLHNAGVSVDEAFEKAFGQSIPSLENELEDYISNPGVPLLIASLEKFEVDKTVMTKRLSKSAIASELGRLLLDMGDDKKDQAARYFEEALAAESENARAQCGLAIARARQGRYEEAVELAEAARAAAPDDALVQLDYGAVLFDQAMSEAKSLTQNEREDLLRGARASFRRSIELNRNQPETLAQLALTYLPGAQNPKNFKGEEPEKGIYYLKQVFEMLPGNRKVNFYLGSFYAATGRTNLASKHHGKVIIWTHGVAHLDIRPVSRQGIWRWRGCCGAPY